MFAYLLFFLIGVSTFKYFFEHILFLDFFFMIHMIMINIRLYNIEIDKK